MRVANKISFSKENSKDRPFSYFDINEEGMLALISSYGTVSPTVYVYDEEGAFQYKYIVDMDGTIYVEWEGENLWIHAVRGNHSVLVDDSGTVLKVEKTLNTDNNNAYKYELTARKKTVEDTTYVSKEGIGPLGLFVNHRAQVLMLDASGEETVIYDVRPTILIRALITIPFVVFIVFLAVSVVILAMKNVLRHQNIVLYGTPYKPNAKRSFYDRILDALEKQKVPKEDDRKDF